MNNQAQHDRKELLALIREKSYFTGDFTLASGKKSDFYIDCRLTTLDARGACLVGRVMFDLISREAKVRGIEIDVAGGLTMGADPIAVAVSMTSHLSGSPKPIQAICVRKEPKGHGQGKQVEGAFQAGMSVAVIDDVITTGSSTLQAIAAIEREGGKVAIVTVLMDREEGGRSAIEQAGYPVASAFTLSDLQRTDDSNPLI